MINDIIVSINDYVFEFSQNVSYLTIQDLTISYSQITGIYTQGGKDVDFNTNVSNINITNCNINNHGNNGIDINGKNLYVANNSVTDLGCKGISVVGGNYYILTPANNLVTNNQIINFSLWKRSYMPGLFWAGVGNIYSYNYISNGPHNGILGGGNQVSPMTNLGGCNNTFEYNYIINTTFEVSDSGSFYTCGQNGMGWIGWDNKLQHNTFENIRNLVPLTTPSGDNAPIEGIYLDDQSSEWIVYNNTFINCQGGILIGGGRHNVLTYNYCVDVDICIHEDNRGMTWQPDPCTPPNGDLFQGLYSVNYTFPPWSVTYPDIVNIPNQQPCVPVFNVIQNNQYCGNVNDTIGVCMVPQLNAPCANTKYEAFKWNDTVNNNVFKCK